MTLSILLLATGCIDGPSGSASPVDQDTGITPAPDAGAMDMAEVSDDMSAPLDMSAPDDMGEDQGEDLGEALDMPALDMSPTEDMTAMEDMPPDMPAECVAGTGSNIAAPYKICEASDLAAIKDAPGGVFELGADITLPQDFNPIPSFSGELRGKGYTISGIHLTRLKAENVVCQENIGYAGGFIHEISGGKIKDVTFSKVRIGDMSTPLGAGSTNCRQIIAGGIFGNVVFSIDNTSSDEGGIDNVIVKGLDVHSRALVGGFAGVIQESDVTNTHVLGDGTAPATLNVQSSAGGIAYQVTSSDLSHVSFQGNIDVTAPTVTMEHSLFITRMVGTTNELDHVMARGNITSNALTGNASGLIAHLLPDSTVNLSLCASEANIETQAQRVGGFIAEFSGSPDLTASLSLCYSGQLSTSQRPSLKGAETVGGILGHVRNSNGEEVSLTSIWTNTDLDSTNMATMNIGCTFGKANTPSNISTLDVSPDNQSPTSSLPYLCNGREDIEQPTGNTFFQDFGGIYRIRSIEAWFAPLRDQNLSLSP